MPIFGQKTGFRARNAGMNEIKSGIRRSDLDTLEKFSKRRPDVFFGFRKSLFGAHEFK
jgi:hypothetical protein